MNSEINHFNMEISVSSTVYVWIYIQISTHVEIPLWYSSRTNPHVPLVAIIFAYYSPANRNPIRMYMWSIKLTTKSMPHRLNTQIEKHCVDKIEQTEHANTQHRKKDSGGWAQHSIRKSIFSYGCLCVFVCTCCLVPVNVTRPVEPHRMLCCICARDALGEWNNEWRKTYSSSRVFFYAFTRKLFFFSKLCAS